MIKNRPIVSWQAEDQKEPDKGSRETNTSVKWFAGLLAEENLILSMIQAETVRARQKPTRTVPRLFRTARW